MSNDNFAEYPNHPGWKAQETSALAAVSVADKAPILRARCLKLIGESVEGLTGNEMAAAMGWDITSIRPRLTELVRLGKIINSGKRRPTPSGCTAMMWVVAPALEDAA